MWFGGVWGEDDPEHAASAAAASTWRRQIRSGDGEQKHKNGNKMPQTLMSTLVDYYFVHFWYLECLCIGGVCEENGAEK